MQEKEAHIVTIVRKLRWSNSKIKCFIGKKSVFRRYHIQNVKEGIQIQVYIIIGDSVHHSRQFISVKVKKNLGASQAQLRDKLRNLRFRQNNEIMIFS